MGGRSLSAAGLRGDVLKGRAAPCCCDLADPPSRLDGWPGSGAGAPAQPESSKVCVGFGGVFFGAGFGVVCVRCGVTVLGGVTVRCGCVTVRCGCVTVRCGVL